MLSREECFKIMGLDQEANSYEIEHRYTMLMKRYRGKSDPESLKILDEITLAYSILTGKYVEPEPIDPRMEEIVFGKQRREWRNIWHYGKVPLLVTILIASFVIYLVHSIVTNEPPDFQIVLAGMFYTTEDSEDRLESYVKEVLPEVNILEFQYLPLDFREPEEEGNDEQMPGTTSGLDPQSQYAYIMKMVTLMAGDSIEVFICDKPVFEQYVYQGPFDTLDDLYASLQDLPADILAQIKPLRRPLDDGSGPAADPLATPTPGPAEEEMNQDLSLPIFGLEITGLDLTEGLGMYADSQVLTLGFKAGDREQVKKFLEAWIRDYARMTEQRQTFEDELARQTTTQAQAG